MSAGLHHESTHYAIRVQGRLGPRWSAWFDRMQLSEQDDGITVLACPVVDQAALQGLLQRLTDVGLTLISIAQIDPDQTGQPTTPPTTEHLSANTRYAP